MVLRSLRVSLGIGSLFDLAGISAAAMRQKEEEAQEEEAEEMRRRGRRERWDSGSVRSLTVRRLRRNETDIDSVGRLRDVSQDESISDGYQVIRGGGKEEKEQKRNSSLNQQDDGEGGPGWKGKAFLKVEPG